MFKNLNGLLRLVALGVVLQASLPGVARASGDFLTTGVKSIDDVFEPADAIKRDLDEAQAQLDLARADLLRALGADDGTDMKTAVQSFAAKANGQFSVKMEKREINLPSRDRPEKEVEEAEVDDGKRKKGGKRDGTISIPFPTLAIAEGASKDVEKAVQSINKALDGVVGVLTTCASIPVRLQVTIAHASKLPVTAPRDIKAAGLSAEAAGQAKAGMKSNLKLVASIPREAGATMKEAKDLIAVFGGVAGGAARAGADAAGTAALGAARSAGAAALQKVDQRKQKKQDAE